MPEIRRVSRVIVTVAVVLAAYGGGVLTGVLGDSADGNAPSAAAPPSALPGLLDQAATTIQQNAATPITREALDKAAVEGMLQALGDRWSSYFSPNDFASFQAVMDGQYTGIGLWVHRDTGGNVSVVSVQTGSPGDEAGIRSGDALTSVAGRAVADRSVADVVAALRGSAGSTVAVTYERAGSEHSVVLRRSSVATEDVAAKITDSVMIIKIRAFSKGVGAEVKQYDATARARHVAGIVLDLRSNPGGLLDEGVATASAFLDGGLVTTFEHRNSRPVVMAAKPGGDTATPLAVLVDGNTASAAEVVTGALQDRNRAVVVGSTTFGKGSVQEPKKLSDGSAIELTVGSYLTPSGRSLDGVGVKPDVSVPAGTSASVAEAEAVEVLSGLEASSRTSGHG